MTMNARSLHKLLPLRCCRRAQWEMAGLGRGDPAWCCRSPHLFGKAGPACLEGPCPGGADVLRPDCRVRAEYEALREASISV